MRESCDLMFQIGQWKVQE